MAITKPKTKANADDFIAAAPDSEPKAKVVKKGNKQQISLYNNTYVLQKSLVKKKIMLISDLIN